MRRVLHFASGLAAASAGRRIGLLYKVLCGEKGKDYEMQPSGILYDSLPMMRLGVRNEDEQVVVAPDFSTFAYMIEGCITLATARIVIPASSPEARDSQIPPCSSRSALR